jgi:hypothetical protein
MSKTIKKYGGKYSSVLKGSDNYMINGQTSSEIAQFGTLPGNDWVAGLGQNAGVTTQMSADAAGPGQNGGKRNKRRTQKRNGNKRRNNSRKQKRNNSRKQKRNVSKKNNKSRKQNRR